MLAAVAVPVAAGLAELVLKPLVGRTLMGALSFPSGTEARVFAVAAVFAVLMADPVRPRIPAAVRLAAAVAVLLAAVAVGVAMVALNQHYFTDTLGGAAVGTGGRPGHRAHPGPARLNRDRSLVLGREHGPQGR